jgi:hypothetical protein
METWRQVEKLRLVSHWSLALLDASAAPLYLVSRPKRFSHLPNTLLLVASPSARGSCVWAFRRQFYLTRIFKDGTPTDDGGTLNENLCDPNGRKRP